MKTCLLVFLLSRLLAAQVQPSNLTGPATATLDGDVVDPEGRPIAAVGIALSGMRSNVTEASDAGGHFRFTGLQAGQYSLTVARTGFLRLTGRLVKVKTGESVTGIRVTLTRQGVISGKVTDDGGWPAANARVHALRYETWEGARQLRAVREAEADDLGRYRIAQLPAGEYYVRATPGWKLTNWDQRYSPTYYPAAYDASEARLAAAEAGKETGGIDVILTRVEGVQISGRVVAPPGTALTPGVPVTLVQEQPLMGWITRSADQMRGGGSFTFRHVRPGTYTLKAGVDTSSYRAGAEPGLGAQQRLVVTDRDIVGIELTLRTLAFEVAGKVAFEGKTEPSSVTVLLNGMNAQSFSATAMADGTFVIKDVVPGRYQVIPGVAGAYVTSVRLGGKEVWDYLDLDGSSGGPLEITMRRSGVVKVEGVVSDPMGVPVQQAFVAFLGKNVPARYRRVVVPVDQFGRFSVGHLVPGEYTVLAVGDSDVARIADDPEFQKANANSIKTVTLVQGDNPPLALVRTAQ